LAVDATARKALLDNQAAKLPEKIAFDRRRMAIRTARAGRF
jgi:hypothetical protein